MTDFEKIVSKDKMAQALEARIKTGAAKYADAYRYAERLAVLAVQHIGGLGGISADDAAKIADVCESVISPVLSNARGIVNKYCADVQTIINKAARIGMRPASVLDDDRISNLVQRIIGADNLEDVAFLTEQPAVENLLRSSVNTNISANAKLHSDAGLTVKVSRSTGAGCCDWCEEIAGVYDYGDEPEDFYKAHRNCTCVWSTYSSKRVLTNMSFDTDSDGNLRRRVE